MTRTLLISFLLAQETIPSETISRSVHEPLFFSRTSGAAVRLRAHAASFEPGDSAIDFGHWCLMILIQCPEDGGSMYKGELESIHCGASCLRAGPIFPSKASPTIASQNIKKLAFITWNYMGQGLHEILALSSEPFRVPADRICVTRHALAHIVHDLRTPDETLVEESMLWKITTLALLGATQESFHMLFSKVVCSWRGKGREWWERLSTPRSSCFFYAMWLEMSLPCANEPPNQVSSFLCSFYSWLKTTLLHSHQRRHSRCQ